MQRRLGKIREPFVPNTHYIPNLSLWERDYFQGINYCLPLLTTITAMVYQFSILRIVRAESGVLTDAPVSELHSSV